MPVKRCSPHWSLQRRLAERSVLDPQTGCLIWTASRNHSGYGHLFWKGVPQLAHRAAWLARNGPIPKGLYVCHRCDVRPCINPDHLFLGTQRDNMIDKALKLGHGRREEGVPERRPHKAPEIIWLRIRGEEIVARILEVRLVEKGLGLRQQRPSMTVSY